MEKRWVENPNWNEKIIERLSSELNISRVISKLLNIRNINTFEQAKLFFRPSLEHLHSPFLMKDMDRAVSGLEEAMDSKDKILIYGDYDVDGTTSVALVYTYLRKIHNQIDYYIPDREKEGYGISYQGIDWAQEHGFRLIVALDCGIKSVEHIAYARKRGIDFIICDHHTPGEKIPTAMAVLNPKRKDCPYPYKDLSGCGIGFKLIQAFNEKKGLPFIFLLDYLDLVAVSIASDIVPLTGENRALAFYGLKKLNESPCPGLKALIDFCQVKNELSIKDIVFQIGPRINAAGRMDDARHAVNLLIADNKELADEKGQIVNVKNIQRKAFDTNITAEALSMLESDPLLKKRKTTVLFNPKWHKGVVGIVASRLIEKYYRPTIVLTESNGVATGSARSVNGFDIYTAISACSDLLNQFGGHRYAAGLTIDLDKVSSFSHRFEEVVNASIKEHSLSEEVDISEWIDLNEISGKLYRIIKQFAPFGPYNMNPVFASRYLFCPSVPQLVGNNHLKFQVQQRGSPVFNCIGFGLGDLYDKIKHSSMFNMCYSLEEHFWEGKTSFRLNVKDIKC